MEDLRENLDEEFFEKGQLYIVNGDPSEAAVYLVNVLRNKEMVPDDIFNQFYLSFSFASQDIVIMAVNLLRSFNSTNAQAIISKKLIRALSEVKHPQPFNQPFLATLVADQ